MSSTTRDVFPWLPLAWETWPTLELLTVLPRYDDMEDDYSRECHRGILTFDPSGLQPSRSS